MQAIPKPRGPPRQSGGGGSPARDPGPLSVGVRCPRVHGTTHLYPLTALGCNDEGRVAAGLVDTAAADPRLRKTVHGSQKDGQVCLTIHKRMPSPPPRPDDFFTVIPNLEFYLPSRLFRRIPTRSNSSYSHPLLHLDHPLPRRGTSRLRLTTLHIPACCRESDPPTHSVLP